MKFSIGDKIVLNRTGEEGSVTAYIDKEMIEVEVNSITFPVHLDEIDHPYLKWFTDKKLKKKVAIQPEQLPVEKEKFRKPRLARGLYLSFLPVFKMEEMEDIVDHLKVYLINELPQSVRFRYDMRLHNRSEFAHEGKMHGFGHIHLHSIAYDDMNDQPRFHWHLSDADRPEYMAEDVLRIRPAKLFEHISTVLKNNEPSFSYLLLDEFRASPKPSLPEPFEQRVVSHFITKSNIRETVEPPKYELDLHIENLVAIKRGLSNADILQIQTETLKHYLQLAILHRQERMFIIHGVGKGVLKEEVHKILKSTAHVLRYSNEYQGLYGFGATEVFFKY